MDLLLARDITENASFELSNVSTDKRALKETRKFHLNEVDFEAPFELRIFSIYDSIQIKIKDSVEVFASLKVAEMPLSVDRQVSQFIQVGGKQMLVLIELGVDKSLMPELLGKEDNGTLGAKLFGGLVTEVKMVQA